MRRVTLVASERPVSYPLEISVFDVSNSNAIHTSSDDGGDKE